jgi:hypothetical protein
LRRAAGAQLSDPIHRQFRECSTLPIARQIAFKIGWIIAVLDGAPIRGFFSQGIGRGRGRRWRWHLLHRIGIGRSVRLHRSAAALPARDAAHAGRLRWKGMHHAPRWRLLLLLGRGCLASVWPKARARNKPINVEHDRINNCVFRIAAPLLQAVCFNTGQGCGHRLLAQARQNHFARLVRPFRGIHKQSRSRGGG